MLEHKLWMGRHVCFVSCSTNSLDPYLEYSKYSTNIYWMNETPCLISNLAIIFTWQWKKVRIRDCPKLELENGKAKIWTRVQMWAPPHTILPPCGAASSRGSWLERIWLIPVTPTHSCPNSPSWRQTLSYVTAWCPSPTNQPQGHASKTKEDVPPKEDTLPLPQMQNRQWEKSKV